MADIPTFLLVDHSLLERLKKANDDFTLAAKKLSGAIDECLQSMQPTQPVTVLDDVKALSIDQGGDGKLHMRGVVHRATDGPNVNGHVYPEGVIRDAINRAVERRAPISVSPDPDSDGTIIVTSAIDPNSETAKRLEETSRYYRTPDGKLHADILIEGDLVEQPDGTVIWGHEGPDL